jgi:D-beta-D-heptose 7-phosphate kinase/D-beta-D-heptose 1-phosphate adenosyltransferase
MSIQQQEQFNVLLIGDICIDEYHYGRVKRISSEAPVPVFEPHGIVVKDGMAGNVKKNLEALGCNVTLISSTNSEGKISVKKRYIDEKSKQHIIRIDEDRNAIQIDPGSLGDLTQYDAVVVSDYNKGAVTYELVEALIKTAELPVFIDTKKTDLARFNGCYVKINKLERSQAVSLPDSSWLIVTDGGKGAHYQGEIFEPSSIESVTDVCGAGDTFLSSLVYKFIDTQDVQQAIVFANRAASITVQHVGVYAPTLEEIKS